MERITGKTELIGLLANPIKHSNSPRMHNEALARVGADYCYLAFEVEPEQLEQAVAGMRALGARGFNISMPYKRTIIQYLDSLSDAAEMCGSVNTVVNDGGTFIGHNTDGFGFWQALRANNIDFVGKKAVLIGPGGAGSAIAVQGALDGVAELAIYSRGGKTHSNGKRIVEVINERTSCKASLNLLDDAEALKDKILESDLLINATKVGMGELKDESIITDERVFHSGLTVCDVVYHPVRTKLMKLAEAHGCRTQGGLDMLLWQGAKSFELWTDKQFPVEEIRNTVFGEK